MAVPQDRLAGVGRVSREGTREEDNALEGNEKDNDKAANTVSVSPLAPRIITRPAPHYFRTVPVCLSSTEVAPGPAERFWCGRCRDSNDERRIYLPRS